MRYGIHTKAHDELAVMTECYEKLRLEVITLHEKIAFLESREVCAAAHEHVETCGYCQRDKLAEALRRYGMHDHGCLGIGCTCGLADVLNYCKLIL